MTLSTAPTGSGWIEVLCGSMFSGKTEELIRRLKRAQIARQRVQIFKPRLDDRFATDRVTSHSKQELDATPLDHIEQLFEKLNDHTRVVGIDEAQFFSDAIVPVVQRLADRGLRVVIAGLDLDYRGIPFGPMPALMAVAETVTKMAAVCTVCGGPACRSQRLTGSPEQTTGEDPTGHLATLSLAGKAGGSPVEKSPIVETLAGNPVLVGGAEWYEARCRRCFDASAS
jgi:thymidine kinase